MTNQTPLTPSLSSQAPLVVEMRGIVKRFPGVLANDHVDFELRHGEIHGLLGENGAGKSTLMNVLAGLYRQEGGAILVNGEPKVFSSPRDAIKSGIGMVHQHFMLVPSQTVTENILLGLDDPRFFLRLPDYDEKIAELGERFGLKVDPRAKVWQLSVGEQQRVEILKMLYRGVDVLIMDEPTAVLAPQEIDGLFKTLRAMIAQGKSVIFISHKLQEVSEIADRVTVLRSGRVTASGVASKGVSRQELARLMVGREIVFFVDKKPVKAGDVILDVKDIYAENDKGLPALRGLSLNVRAGEIVGVAGVAGNGQSELSHVISGMRECDRGEVLFNGDKISNRTTLFGIQHGMAYVPEDRTHVGSAPNLSVTDNVIMKNYRKPPISNNGLLDMKAAVKLANELQTTYDIIVPNVSTPVRLLSGGNLQRVILAREISGNPAFMVAVQPTRGLDVGAIEGVHKLLLAQREAGSAILLISEELEELLALSDRVYVVYEGKIMGEVKMEEKISGKNLIETIGMMMTGTPLAQIQKEGVAAHG
ncbi:MAG: ABC transporter ATP-binding protein [Anaerolineales bacterium]|nr:ABC transporter ATP-binding protein [Anaerolineales bacterium]